MTTGTFKASTTRLNETAADVPSRIYSIPNALWPFVGSVGSYERDIFHVEKKRRGVLVVVSTKFGLREMEIPSRCKLQYVGNCH